MKSNMFHFFQFSTARYAIATPSPVETNGFEVTLSTCPDPPVAKTVAFATMEVHFHFFHQIQ